MSLRATAVTDSPPSDLQITVLGAPAVAWRGRPLTLGRLRARALLYRIATAPRAVPRDHLCFLLWPDEPDSAARRSLSVLLAHVKAALPVPNALVVDPDGIALDHTAARSDAVQWSSACAAAVRERRVELLQPAADLYRGPLLQGFSVPGCPEYQAWLEGERRAVEWRLLHVLGALIEVATAAGNTAAAIAAAERYLSVDPLAEEQHRQLMLLRAAAGDRAAALRQWDLCVRVLERELGVEPLPETRSVYQAVRDGRSPPLEQQGGTRLAPHVAGGRARAPVKPDRPQASALHTGSRQLAVLPAAPNRLLGREREVGTVSAMLAAGARLVTLTGPGGVGKTRLAVEVGYALRERYADGVVWIPLAPLRDAAAVADALAQACAVPTGGRPAVEAVCDWVRDKHLLLLVDNLEHVLAAAPLLSDLLAAGKQLQILATSRARLNLQHEQIVPVVPLPLPQLDPLPPLAALSAQPAIALLLARARQRTPTFRLTAANAAALTAVCVRLDGLPLAIELAAVRLMLLSPEQLLRRLDHRLALLADGPRDLPARQGTLRATIAWSCDLLPASAQHLFARLAVFAGGCTFDAAATVCGAGSSPSATLTDLEALVDLHLVQADIRDTSRYIMLETLRAYAAERLEASGEADLLRERHADYFRTLAEAAEGELLGPRPHGPLNQLDDDQHNLMAAWDWLLGHADAATLYRLARPCFWFWFERGHWRAGAERLQNLLASTSGDRSPERALALVACAALLYRSGSLQQGIAYGLEGYAAAAQGGDPIALGMAAMNMSQQAPDAEQRLRYARESVATLRAMPQPTLLAAALGLLGDELRNQGHLAAAKAAYTESVDLLQALGSAHGTVNPLGNLGRLALLNGDIAAAQRTFAECVAVARRSGSHVTLADWLLRLGVADVYTGNLVQARAALEEARTLAHEATHRLLLPNVLAWQALEAVAAGEHERAREALGPCLDGYIQLVAVEGERPELIEALLAAAHVHAAAMRADLAAMALGAADQIAHAQAYRLEPPLEGMLAGLRDSVRGSLGGAAWQMHAEHGRTLPVADLLAGLVSGLKRG